MNDICAFLFAGQGSQTVGMGTTLAAAHEESRATFEAADYALGFPLSKIMADGPAEDLRRTAIAQPALLTLAVAQAYRLRALGIKPRWLAGHSLGQYAALVMSGALDFQSAVRLVAARGQLMQQAVPEGEGTMMAIVGLDREDVYAACQTARSTGIVNVACHNSPGQTVISGAVAAVAAAANLCEERGGGVVSLEVSAPFHCDLMLAMVPAFTQLVEAAPIADPVLPVIDNVTAQPFADAASVRRSLIAQLTSPVLFEESLATLRNAGVRHFIQCGPGKNLLSFAKRVVSGANLETFEEAESRSVALSEG
jgi:[acyl-carrier-protein] S-malonyltransferase